MKSLTILPAFYLTSCHAAAIQPYGQDRDVPLNTPTQASPTDVNPMASALGLTSIISPALTPTNNTSTETTTAPTSTDSGLTPTILPPPVTTTLAPTAETAGPPSSSPSPSPSPSTPTVDPNTICTNTTATPDLANYTQPYTCTLKPGADYALLGMYYDTCSVLPLTPSSSPSLPLNPQNSTTSTPDTLFCCDPTYSQPSTFDTLCIWGSGMNITVSNLPPDFDPRNITRPEGAAGVGRCMVSPVIRPRARCVQVMVPVGEGEGESEG